MEKTMVIKILEQKKIKYEAHYYNPTSLDAVSVATLTNQDVNKVFKTLVTKSDKNKYYCFMVPAAKELDLKKVAKTLNEKKIDMIPQKELEPLTGYVHGGCSPIGMKKHLPTFIDKSALDFDTILYSGGKIGVQVETTPTDLMKLMNIRSIDLTKE